MTDEELIKRVATEVVGWELRDQYYYLPEETDFYKPLYYIGEFDPLTDLNHAFMVVERMRELGWWITFKGNMNENIITFGREWIDDETGERFDLIKSVDGSTIGHAVCEAALKAVENG